MSSRDRAARVAWRVGALALSLARTGSAQPLPEAPRAVELASGEEFTCLRAADGSVWCWGDDRFGARGVARGSAASLEGRAARVRGVAGAVDLRLDPLLGGCARTAGATLTCWGDALEGRLGNGRSDLAPGVATVPGLRGVLAASTRGRNGCAVLEDHTARCWGVSTYGQVGDGTRVTRLSPTLVRELASAVDVALGEGGVCARTLEGTARCWGWDWSQVGNASVLGAVTTPRAVAGLGRVTALWAGDYQMFAARADGALLAFGAGDHGMLGDARLAHEPSVQRAAPTPVAGVRGVTQLAAGRRHACAVTSRGEVWCWGSNPSGQRGDGTVGTDERRELERRPDGDVTCLRRHPGMPLEDCRPLRRGGAVQAYGRPSRVVALPPARQVAVGAGHTCAVTREGEAWCWGANDHGQLGDGTQLRRPRPARVVGLTGVEEVALGREHSCARTRGGDVWCWGHNHAGQLGDAPSPRRLTPGRVRFATSR